LVVVGDEIAGNASEKGAIVGEAVNLAARLQTLAEPNSVATSASTRQLAAERFAYRDLGFRDIKGFDTPVPVYQVIGEREVSRLAARSTALTPFVGRDTEIETICARWARALSENGQVVIIAGEAGIGKSRIAAEACSQIRASDPSAPLPFFFQCSPYRTNAPLYPVIKELERLAEISRSQPVEENLKKLKTLLKVEEEGNDRPLALFADLLDLAPDDRRQTLVVSASAKRNLTIEALNDWVARCARETPLILVFEDVQWIDLTSKVLLNRLIDWAHTARTLLLITLRIESSGAENWSEEAGLSTFEGQRQSYVTVCEIGELGEADAERLAAAAAEGKTIPGAQLRAILAKSDGIPLYLEELVRAVVDRVDFSSNRNQADQTDAVPNTLRDALMAQLDQLGDTKEIAQDAVVIGQEFSISLLAKIANKPIEDLLPELRRLTNSKIVVQDGRTSEVYRFKHALVRDISYQSLLRRSRRQTHRRVAAELADPTTEVADATDDLIAQHYSRGEAYSEAIQFWQRGAKAAIARSAHEEALAMLEAARRDLRRLPAADWRAVELDLVLAQAAALRSLRGYSAPEVEERLLEARELCSMCADNSNRFNVEWSLFQCTIVKRDIEAARQLAAGLFEHARRHPDVPLVDAYLANGMVAVNAGEFETARRFLEQGVSLTRPETDQPHFFAHGQNPGLFCLSYLARALCFLGYLDCSRAAMNRCLSVAANRAHDPGHLYGYVNALMHAVRVYNLCGDLDAEERFAKETNEIARRNHYAYYEALSACHLGWVAGARGFLSEGIDRMIGALAALGQTATSLALPGLYLLLAQLYIRVRQWDEASKLLQVAVGAKGHAVWDADVERVRGDLLSLRADCDLAGAENAYRSSLAVARHQRAGLLEFKAGLRLAELLRHLHRAEEGIEILSASFKKLHGELTSDDGRRARMLLSTFSGMHS